MYNNMSGQVRFGSCERDWRTPRPYLVPTFVGSFSPDERPDYPKGRCWSYDGKEGPFGSGIPTMESADTCPMSGTGKGRVTVNNVFETAEGAVKLPIQTPTQEYIPSVDGINQLFLRGDTRLQPQPLRFFS